VKAYRIIARGIVQGVGFRYHTSEKANSLNLQGTVENQSDGSVLIYVQGEEAGLLEFLDWCHSGPSASTVKSLDYEIVQPSKYQRFQIKR